MPICPLRPGPSCNSSKGKLGRIFYCGRACRLRMSDKCSALLQSSIRHVDTRLIFTTTTTCGCCSIATAQEKLSLRKEKDTAKSPKSGHQTPLYLVSKTDCKSSTTVPFELTTIASARSTFP